MIWSSWIKSRIRIKELLTILFVGFFFVWSLFLFSPNQKGSEWERHFAILPHFMLDSEKVDQFYKYLNNYYYGSWNLPDKIILVSPNHFHSELKQPLTICKTSDVYYKSESINLSNDLNTLWIDCDNKENLFYSWGETIQTQEHGIWDHFQWINKYFKWTKVLPLIISSQDRFSIESIFEWIRWLTGKILVLTSVDFSHYQPEDITLEHDKKSIEILERWTLNKPWFLSWIDADCPACLYFTQFLANDKWQHAKLRYRDSSSTILGKDMSEENTSRIFMWYE